MLKIAILAAYDLNPDGCSCFTVLKLHLRLCCDVLSSILESIWLQYAVNFLCFLPDIIVDCCEVVVACLLTFTLTGAADVCEPRRSVRMDVMAHIPVGGSAPTSSL
jgi:hypothetical protein